MKKKKSILLLALFVALLGGLTWLLAPPQDRLFRGKPERFWIERLSDGRWSRAQDQVGQWREFGPEGIRVLVRALNQANRPIERACRNTHRRLRSWLPNSVMRLLPAPPNDSTRLIRESVVEMLWRLGKEANIAAPAVACALKDDDPVVRYHAFLFFIGGEIGGENVPLNQMDEKEKRKLLPDFIEALQKEGLDLNYNAAVALGYYPEQRALVAPVLLKALRDSTGTGFPDMGAASSRVWIATAEALNRIAPDELTKAGFVRLLVRTWKDQKIDWVADLLGEMRAEPALTVPALIESLGSTNICVASTAVRSLSRFKEQADAIIPALEKAARREDGAGACAQAALKRLESETRANQGAQP